MCTTILKSHRFQILLSYSAFLKKKSHNKYNIQNNLNQKKISRKQTLIIYNLLSLHSHALYNNEIEVLSHISTKRKESSNQQ